MPTKPSSLSLGVAVILSGGLLASAGALASCGSEPDRASASENDSGAPSEDDAATQPAVDAAGDGDGSSSDIGPTLPTLKNPVVQLTNGGLHTCARFADGKVKCWGYGIYGELGNELPDIIGALPGQMGANLIAVNLGPNRIASAIASQANFNCAIRDDHSLTCWGGSNGGDCLGLGTYEIRGRSAGTMGANLPSVKLGAGRTARSIYTGVTHSCAILDDSSVKCWGNNSSGHLGYEDTTPRGIDLAAMGDNLPAVNLGTGRTAKSLSLGNQFSCAILDDDTLKCWGAAPGIGPRPLGTTVGDMGDNLPIVHVGAGRTVKAVSVQQSVCAILDDDSLKCWGTNTHGELGYGDTNPRLPGDSLAAVDLGAGHHAKQVLTLGLPSLSSARTCVILEDDSVRCWGTNENGELGKGDTTSAISAALAPKLDLGTGRKAKALAGGVHHTCALLENGSVKCWGDNAQAQLGYGDTARRGDKPSQMGDNLPVVDLGER